MEGPLEENKKRRVSKKRNITVGQGDIAPTCQEIVPKVDEKVEEKSQEFSVHSELVEYVNKLEFMVVNTRIKLLKERKAYSSVLSSLALFFGIKGITPEQVEEYVSTAVKGMKESQEDEQEKMIGKLDWIGFLQQKQTEHAEKEATHQQQLQLQQQQVAQGNLHTANGNNSNGNTNVIRIQMNGQEQSKKGIKQKRNTSKQQQPTKNTNIQQIAVAAESNNNSNTNNYGENSDEQMHEPKLKKKRRTTTPNDQYGYQETQQPQQPQMLIPFQIPSNLQTHSKRINLNITNQQLLQSSPQEKLYQQYNEKFQQFYPYQQQQVNILPQQLNHITPQSQQLRISSLLPQQFNN